MIVVCVNNNFGYLSEPWITSPGCRIPPSMESEHLLIGKLYKCIRSDSESFLIDELGWFYRWRFVTLESYRDRQIDSLGL